MSKRLVILRVLFIAFCNEIYGSFADVRELEDAVPFVQTFFPEQPDIFSRSNDKAVAIHSRRRLIKGQRPCNAIIGTLSAAQIKHIFKALIDGLFPPESEIRQNEAAKKDVINKLRYSIQARKICASCTMFQHYDHGKMESDAFGDYCGQNAYGHDVIFSGLLLLPIDEQRMLLKGSLRGAIWHHLARAGSFDVPSDVWPKDGNFGSNWTDVVSNYDLLGGMASSASGFVSILPDGFGYGKSSRELFKSYLVKRTYQTSTIPLWLEAQSFLSKLTKCNTTLAKSAVVSGYSEGGYAAVASAAALSKLGVDIIASQPGGGPYQISSVQILHLYENIENGSFPTALNYILALFGLAYSSTNPDLSNTNEGEDLLSHKYMLKANDEKNVLKWFRESGGYSKDEINSIMPMNILDIFNSFFVDFLKDAVESNVKAPCKLHSKTRYIYKLCQTLMENDLVNIIQSSPYPIRFCHSNNDTVNAFENIPDFGKNSYLSLYNSQAVSGNHLKAGLTCLYGNLQVFTNEVDSILPPSKEACVAHGSESIRSSTIWMACMGVVTVLLVVFVVWPFLLKEKKRYEPSEAENLVMTELGIMVERK